MTAVDSQLIAAIEETVWARGGKQQGRDLLHHCPNHSPDAHPSARWNPEKQTAFCDVCQQGWGALAYATLLGIPSDGTRTTPAEPAAIYEYRDDEGALDFQVVRYPGKRFAQRRPDGAGWKWKQGNADLLYRLPDVLATDGTVHVVEGEKDADRLHALGATATCNPGGAGKWRTKHAEWLRGRPVIILGDNDAPGLAHAAAVAQSLKGVAGAVKIVALPELPEKGDISDWLDAGHTVYELLQLEEQTPEFDSSAYKDGARTNQFLRFKTAREIADETPETPDAIAPGIVIRGAITELTGKIKTAGKTTFLGALVHEVIGGKEFLGRQTRKTRVVWLTEQPPSSFREALRRADLLDSDDVFVLSYGDTIGTQWPDVVRVAVQQAKQVGADLLIVDTLPQFVRLIGDSENGSGFALESVAPLQEAAGRDNLAIIVVRHDRKSGGDVGDSGRGSSAFGGAADIVLQLRREDGNPRPSVRVLSGIGRFDGVPDSLMIELGDDGTYRAIGDQKAAAREGARRQLLDSAPESELTAKTLEELTDRFTTVKRTLAHEAVTDLLNTGEMQRAGEGKRKSPYRYWRYDPETVSSAVSSAPKAQADETNEPSRIDSSALHSYRADESNGYVNGHELPDEEIQRYIALVEADS
jgi:hypothetical protein